MRGWKALAVLISLIVICWASFTWALSTLVLTGITFTGFDALSFLMPVWPWMLIGGMPAGMILQGVAHWSSVWTDRLPLMSDVPDAAALTGATTGVVIATCASPSPTAWLIGGSVGLVLGFFTVRMLRAGIVDIREQRDEIERLDELHAVGTCVRADVEEVKFLHTWRMESPLFEVTATYDAPSGRHRASGRVLSSIAGAPVIGGTVLLWFVGDGADACNVDMDEDPDSIRDPEAHRLYEPPPT